MKSIDLGMNNLNILPLSVFDNQVSLKVIKPSEEPHITSVEKTVFGLAFRNLSYLGICVLIHLIVPVKASPGLLIGCSTHTNISELSNHYRCNLRTQYHGSPVMLFDVSRARTERPI